MIHINPESYVLLGSLLLFASVLAGKAAYRFGAPALLLFLLVGMIFGLDIISFNSADVTQFIGMIALSIILFSGGMDTAISEIRPVLAPGIVLATLGVVLTAGIVGGFVYWITSLFGIGLSLTQSLLLAAIMSSTDSASVFSILRSKKQGLKQHLRPLLELESGSNDPMAYILTVLLVGMLAGPTTDRLHIGHAVLDFAVQMSVGALVGYLAGRFAVWAINRINIANQAFYPILLLAFVFFSFAFADLVHGNGYLAVYIAGLMVGNHTIVHKRTLTVFFDGFTWLFQIIMFLTLGLLVNLNELETPNVLLVGTLVGLFLILVARPLAVFLLLAPFRRFTFKARLYVAWVGLRGAVPIIFATYPLVMDVPGARFFFNVVFLVTILSLLIQGTTVSSMANALRLAEPESEPAFGIDLPDRIKTAMVEMEVNEAMLDQGDRLADMNLPRHTLVVMVRRGDRYFIPGGQTRFCPGDRLLVISDDDQALRREYEALGVDKDKVLRIR